MSRLLLFASLSLITTGYLALRQWPHFRLQNSTTLTLAAAFALQFVIFALYWMFIFPFFVSPLRNLPEPTGARFPWAHARFTRKEPNGVPFRRWASEVPNQGLIRIRLLFNREKIFITSPEALREVLVTKSYEFCKPPQPVYAFRVILGNGILVAEGDEHKRQRKSLSPAFSFRHIKDLYPVFWTKASLSTQALSAAIKVPKTPWERSSAVQNASAWASRVTLDIIGSAGMGHEFNAINDPDGEAISTYRQLFHREPPFFYWQQIGLSWVPLKLIFSLPIPMVQNVKKMAAKIEDIGVKMIEMKKAVMMKGGRTEYDILSVALESGGFSDDELVNQLMTFLAAGHETTASALTWAVYLLCKNPEIQSRLRDEIRSHLPSSSPDCDVTAADIDHLPYLNAVCNEVLRFMPSVPTTTREAVQDTTILGQFVPKGTQIFISPWATNVSKELWGEDAETFNPERWLAGEDKANNTGGATTNFAMMTFLHGPRSCIGKDFSKAELLCLLAAWIGKFEVELENPNYEGDMAGHVTVRPRDGLYVKFKEVDGW